MKKITLLLGLSALAGGAFAQSSHYVSPYYRSDGAYVQGHQQTNPDSSRTNNWSSQGNVNPYTGETGTVNPYAQPNPYQAPQPLYQPRQPQQQRQYPQGRLF